MEDITRNDGQDTGRMETREFYGAGALPEGMETEGDFDVEGDGEFDELPRGMRVNGDLKASRSGISRIGDGLYVAGRLDLSYTPVPSLPDNLEVGGDLDLTGTGIKELPSGLKVGGDLDLTGTAIKEIPEGVSVAGKVITGDEKDKEPEEKPRERRREAGGESVDGAGQSPDEPAKAKKPREKAVFLRDFYNRDIHGSFTGDGQLTVSMPGRDGLKFKVDAGARWDSKDRNGKRIRGMSNIRLGAADTEIEVTHKDKDGKTVHTSRRADELLDAWMATRSDYSVRMGPKVYLRGVDESMIRETDIPKRAGSKENLVQVSVYDPESARQPVFENGEPAPGQYRRFGYGSFYVFPGDVMPCEGEPGKVDIYIGRSAQQLTGYKVFTGEFGEDGAGIYRSAERTAIEARDNYEAGEKAWKSIRDRAAEGPEDEFAEEPDIGDEFPVEDPGDGFEF